MTRRRTLHIAVLVLVFATMLILPVWTILTWAEEPHGLFVQSGVTEKEVPVGGTIHLVGFISVPPDCRVSIFRTVYDSSGTAIGVLNELVQAPNGTVRSNRELSIPGTAAVGKAAVHRLVQWSCNWPQQLFPRLRPIMTLEFTIVPAERAEVK